MARKARQWWACWTAVGGAGKRLRGAVCGAWHLRSGAV